MLLPRTRHVRARMPRTWSHANCMSAHFSLALCIVLAVSENYGPRFGLVSTRSLKETKTSGGGTSSWRCIAARVRLGEQPLPGILLQTNCLPCRGLPETQSLGSFHRMLARKVFVAEGTVRETTRQTFQARPKSDFSAIHMDAESRAGFPIHPRNAGSPRADPNLT